MCQLQVTANVCSSPIVVTLMMEALCSSELSVLTRATRPNIPEDGILQPYTWRDLLNKWLKVRNHGTSWLCMDLKPNLWHQGWNIERSWELLVFWTLDSNWLRLFENKVLIGMLGSKGMKWQEVGGNCFVTFSLPSIIRVKKSWKMIWIRRGLHMELWWESQ
jgi:hypothetical protein